MFITHTIISKILVNVLFVTFISIMAVKAWKPINAFLLSSLISTSDNRTIFLPALVPIKRCQCHDKDVCISRMWPDDGWTVGIDSMFRMYHHVLTPSCLWNWHVILTIVGNILLWTSTGLLFPVYLMFSFCCQ